MQVRIQFSGNVRLPIASGYPIQGMLYNVMRTDLKLSTFLHDGGYSWGSGEYKLFVFGAPKGNCRVRGKEIFYSEGFSLEVRSALPAVIDALADGFAPGKICDLYGNSVTSEKVTVTDDHITTDTIHIEMLSPVVVKRRQGKKTIYYAPSDAEFSDLINTNLYAKYAALTGELPQSGIEISGVANERRIVTRFKNGLIVNGFLAQMTLSGYAKELDLLYQTGLGAKNAQGFGLFRVRGDVPHNSQKLQA